MVSRPRPGSDPTSRGVRDGLQHPVAVPESADLAEQAGGERRDVDRLEAHELRLFGAREQQQVGHDPVHPAQFVVHQRDGPLHVGRIGGVEDLQVTADDGDGRAQFVPGVVEEAALRGDPALHPVQHGVHRPREVGELVTRPFHDRDAAGQIGHGDAVRRRRDITHRSQDPAGDHPGAARREQSRHPAHGKHQPGGVVGGLPLLVGEVRDDGHPPGRITGQRHRHGEVAHLPGTALVPPGRRLGHRAHQLGELGVLAEEHRCLDAALEAVPAVDVAEELLVGSGQVVGDHRPQHVGDGAERGTGLRIDARLDDLREVHHLGVEGQLHPFVGGGDQQSPGHQRHQRERQEHQQQDPADDPGAGGTGQPSPPPGTDPRLSRHRRHRRPRRRPRRRPHRHRRRGAAVEGRRRRVARSRAPGEEREPTSGGRSAWSATARFPALEEGQARSSLPPAR